MRIRLLLIGGILLVTILFVSIVQLFGLDAPKKPLTQEPFASPTPIATSPSIPTKGLVLVSILPVENITRKTFPIQQIVLTFNKPVSPQAVVYSVDPKVTLTIDTNPNDPNSIVITPDPVWAIGITTFILQPNTKAVDGTQLNQTVRYQLNAQFPGDEGFREVY